LFCLLLGKQEELPNKQKEDLISMYDCIYKAVYLLEQELYEDKTKRLFTYENQSEEMRLNYLFDRIWYVDTCNKIKQLPTEKIQEFINNKSKWNDQIQQLLLTISHIVKNRELNPSDVSYYLDAWKKKRIRFDS
jgi:hypothetical protein